MGHFLKETVSCAHIKYPRSRFQFHDAVDNAKTYLLRQVILNFFQDFSSIDEFLMIMTNVNCSGTATVLVRWCISPQVSMCTYCSGTRYLVLGHCTPTYIRWHIYIGRLQSISHVHDCTWLSGVSISSCQYI